MAALSAATWTAYWIILPITLLASVIFRFNLFSCIYLLFVLALPFTPHLSLVNLVSWSRFALTLAFMSGFFILCQVGFQIALLSHSPYGSLIGDNCSTVESITRYIGLVRFNNLGVEDVFRLLLPDVAVFVVSSATYVLAKKIRDKIVMDTVAYRTLERHRSKKISRLRLKHGAVFCITMIFMALAGIAFPSVISSIYFLVFIALATAWAFLKPLIVRSTAILRAALTVVTILQLVFLYIYQLDFMQSYIPPDAIYSRLLGLNDIIRTDCNATYSLLLNPDLPWTEFVNPVCIFLLHWTLAVGVQMFYADQQELQVLPIRIGNVGLPSVFPKSKKLGEKKPLVEAEDLPQNYNSTGSVGGGTENLPVEDEVPVDEMQRSPEDEAPFPSGSGERRSGYGSSFVHQRSIVSFNKGALMNISIWFSQIKRYSFYVIALIVMMLWSVTYHSWFTFILLLGSCILWMMKERARFTLLCSPVLVFYGICLILLQFIYSLNLNEAELPTVINESSNFLILADFGIVRFTSPCLHLGAQLLYLCGFWIVLHQFNYRRQRSIGSDVNRSGHTITFTDKTAAFLYDQLCKYWIFLVVAFHLVVASEGSPTGIKLTYMLFFLLNMVTYCISWTFWRRTLTFYWTILVGYIMLVVVLIYTFQFQSFPDYYKQLTHFTDHQLADLGLRKADNAGTLLVMILIPTVFLLFVILQLQYFNTRFLALTQKPLPTHVSRHRKASEQSGPTGEGTSHMGEIEMDDLARGTSHVIEDEQSNWFSRKFGKWLPKITNLWNGLVSFVMLAFEFHVWRLVFLTVFVSAVYQISAVYALYVFFWVLLLPLRKTHLPLFLITSCTTALTILGIMFYQLQFVVADSALDHNCTMDFYGKNVTKRYHLTDWIAIGKMPEGGAFFYHVQGYLSIIIMIAFERTIIRRQLWLRKNNDETAPIVTAFYPKITYKEVDNNIKDCTKFFLNYFFFKFGIEACYVMSVITVWVRADVFSIVYCFFLIIALCLKQKALLYRFWGFYVASLMLLVVWQYAALLGMPPVWCEDHNYPWLILGTNQTLRNRLVTWFHLPDYIAPREISPSIADFMQLLFVVSQLFVFQLKDKLVPFVGDNKYLTGNDLDVITNTTNPKKNFFTKKSRSMLDQCKQFVFAYFIWITMAIIFLAGTSQISAFTLGYFIIFFYLLARQQKLLTGKPSDLLKLFTGLIGYTVAVITLKAGLQLASCVYIEQLQTSACVVVQLMSLSCTKPYLYDISVDFDSKCEMLENNSDFSWDFVCFVFLLIQRRIFASYYFMHVAEDMRISFELASRGAELFNENLIKAVKKREKIQEENLSAIKHSMRAIRKSYHSLRKTMDCKTNHLDAVRAGDFYMFEEDVSFKKLYSVESRERDEEEREDREDVIMDPVKMLFKAETVGISETLEERRGDKKKLQDDAGKSEVSLTVPSDTSSARPGSLVKFKENITERTFEPDPRRESILSTDQEEAMSVEGEESDVDTVGELALQVKKEPSFADKAKQGLEFVWELFLSGVDALILFLNRRNKTYRNIVLQLSAEKDDLVKTRIILPLEQQQQRQQQQQPQQLEQQQPQQQEQQQQQLKDKPDSASNVVITIGDEDAESKDMEVIEEKDEEHSSHQDDDDDTYTTPKLSLDDVPSGFRFRDSTRPIQFDKDQPRILRLFYAIWYVIISRTDVVCYFLIILNLMLKASVLSLVLPLAVFLWGTFVIPRPAKYFWTFAIVYLEIVIVVKFIFQFEFWGWNSDSEVNMHINDPFWWPRFVGVNQSPNWSVMELLQLLAIFFHVSVLKVHGLWDHADLQRESVTSDDAVPMSSTTTDNLDMSDGTKKESKSFTDTIKQPFIFYHKLLNQRFTSVTDVYLWMFLCDVINFLIIIFGYSAFGKYATAEGTIVTDIQSNNVPTAFLVMLLIQFIIMFIDRAIYLNKSLMAKFIFQVVLVIGIHVWMFIILPSLNQRPFYENHVAQTYYFFKAVYFLLAAYQIRAGYPKRVAGNFLTKSYGTVNLFLFKGFRAIPFLAEITAIMDWMYTDTSMSIGEWMKLWAIHAEVFELKCWRVFEDDYPTPRGEAKAKWIKYLLGGLLLFILLAIIWFPLLLMNIALTIGGLPNNPTQVDVRITVGPFEPIFQVVADFDDITVWNKQQFEDFSLNKSSDETAAAFLRGFSEQEVVTVNIEGESKTVWIISPPQRKQLIRRLSKDDPRNISVLFEWTLTNDPAKTSLVTSSGSNTIQLGANDTARQQLYTLLSSEETSDTDVIIQHLFPEYILSSSSTSKSTPAYSLYPRNSGNAGFADIGMSIKSLPNQTETTSWWRINDKTTSNPPHIKMIVFSNKVSPSSLNFLVSYGIIGLYVSVVLVVGGLVRTIFIGTTASIMFTELPYVDRILNLCNDIFLVREEAEYVLEEDLYAKLIFLYRSPRTLIQWTRKSKTD